MWTTRWLSSNIHGWGWWYLPSDGGLIRTLMGGCFTSLQILCSMSTCSFEFLNYMLCSLKGFYERRGCFLLYLAVTQAAAITHNTHCILSLCLHLIPHSPSISLWFAFLLMHKDVSQNFLKYRVVARFFFLFVFLDSVHTISSSGVLLLLWD